MLGVFMIGFSLFWLLFSSIIFLANGSYFLILFLLIGIFMFYFSLVQLFNKNVLMANRHDIVSKSRPLPWLGNVSIDTREVDQLFVMEDGNEKVGSKVTILYSLKAQMRNGKSVALVRMIRDKDLALELEARLERHLNIEDRALVLPEEPMLTRLKETIPALKHAKLPGPINDGKPGAAALDGPANQTTVAPRMLTGFAEQDVFASRLGSAISLMRSSYVITTHNQLDWSDGRSDVALELQSEESRTDIYAEQKSGRKYLYFEERLLTDEESGRLGFPKEGEPPAIIQNGDDKYYRRHDVSGYSHLNHSDTALVVEQCIYFRTTGLDRFRVLNTSNGLKVYIQEPLPDDSLAVLAAEKQSILDKLKR